MFFSLTIRLLSGANLSDVNFRTATLIAADLSQANLASADFTGAALAGADMRGATPGAVGLDSADTSNTIFPDGSVRGLDLGTNERLVVRDYELPLRIEQSITIAESATLELLLADATWGSTIGVEPGVIPNLGGTLALNVADDANVRDLVGVAFGLFDWNGQLSPDQRFEQIAMMPGHVWDTSQLYTTGYVQLLAVSGPAGDFNLDGLLDTRDVDLLVSGIVDGENSTTLDMTSDGIVDDADLSMWLTDAAIANGFTEAYLLGDANLDGVVNAVDLNEVGIHWLQDAPRWSAGDFTANGTVNALDLNKVGIHWLASIPSAASPASVPEPAAFTLLLLGIMATPLLNRRRAGRFSHAGNVGLFVD